MRRAPTPVQVANERVKAASGLLYNAGGALGAAALVRFYNILVVDNALALWSLGAAVLIYIGWLTLSLLEHEVEDVRG